MNELEKTFQEYTSLLGDPRLPQDAMRKDLKHMTFWQEYCARVVTDVGKGETPKLVRGTYAAINEQAQIDYDSYSNQQLFEILSSSLSMLTGVLATIDSTIVIPYKQHVRGYTAPEYVDMMGMHYQMHIKHLEKLLS